MQSGERISQLPPGPSSALTDIYPSTQGNITYKFTLQQILTLYSQYLAPLTGATFTGSVFVPPADSFALLDTATENQVVPYQNVQMTSSSLVGFKHYCNYGTTFADNLNSTYFNGPDNNGVGATLTASGNVSLYIDGAYVQNGDVILVESQNDLRENGKYVVTDNGYPGAGGRPWILTRTSDFDNSPTGIVSEGCLTSTLNGNVNEGKIWYLIAQNPIVNIGTDEISFYSPPNFSIDLTAGEIALNNGTIFVNNFFVNLGTIIQTSYQDIIGTPGFLSTPSSSIIPGVGFTLNSTSSSDNSVVGYSVVQIQSTIVLFGQVTLSAGRATINTSAITPGSVIILSITNAINSLGTVVVTSITPGVGFSISSGYGIDNSLISWAVYNSSSTQFHNTVNLSAGTASVSYPAIATDSVILLTIQNPSITYGDIGVGSITNGVGFSIISNNAADISTIGWVVYDPTSIVPKGTGVLTAGTTMISNSNVLSTSSILLTAQVTSSSFGCFSANNIINSSSFNVNSNSLIDTSTVGYVILNK